MKKLLIKSVSLILILFMSAFMMFSCSGKFKEFGDNIAYMLGHIGGKRSNFGFPEGWTGGFDNNSYGLVVENWWVESFDELLVAINKLKSHGSTFATEQIYLNAYEGDLFDVKYCIRIKPQFNRTEKIKFGDDPFDRYAGEVEIYQWFFFDNVTIDEINYGLARNYRGFEISITDYCYENYYKADGMLLPRYDYRKVKEDIYDGSYYRYITEIYSSKSWDLLATTREYPSYLTSGDGLLEINEDVINAVFMNTRRLLL